MTSAAILSAMMANGSGHLYSIDLPALSDGWAEQTGAAVTPELRARWTYVRGSARRRLPKLIRALGSIDFFVHDSLHTYDNMRFEFGLAWPALRPGGVLIADDIQDSRAFDELVPAAPAPGSDGPRSWLVADEVAKPSAAWGLVVKRS
jgi:predicted O-methyltransferase YrrM